MFKSLVPLSSLLACTFSLRLALWPIQRRGSQAQLGCQSAAAYISALQLSQGRIIPPANHRSTPSIHPIHLSVKQIRTPSPSPPQTTSTTTTSPSSFQNNCHHRSIEIPLTLKPAHPHTNIYRHLNRENTQKDTSTRTNTGQRNDLK